MKNPFFPARRTSYEQAPQLSSQRQNPGKKNSTARLIATAMICSSCSLFAMVDPETPPGTIPANGDPSWTLHFSDEFNGTSVDLNKWEVDVSLTPKDQRSSRGIPYWYWKHDNVYVDGAGSLVLDVDKYGSNTMFCGSVSSDPRYKTKYGYLEARIQVADNTKDTHTAFWFFGGDMGSSTDGTAYDGAEVDIFETAWFGDYTKSNIHIDGYGANHQSNDNIYITPGIHNGYHTFGAEWNEHVINIYYDGLLKTQYEGKWVPRVPSYLWLSDGANFGDVGTFTLEPAGFLTAAKVDYARVWKPTSPPVMHIVGGDKMNGNFNSYPGVSRSYLVTPGWYNLGTGSQDDIATRTDISYDGSQNAVITCGTGRELGLNTGYAMVEGDEFDIKYLWKDDWNWVDSTDKIRVRLFVTSDNTLTGTRTDLVSVLSGVSTQNNTYEAFSADGIYTVTAADAGKVVFVSIDGNDSPSGGWGRLDNFELIRYSASAPANASPVFYVDKVIETDARENKAYSSTLADNVSDLDGDSLTYTKVSGPAWLAVASDGTLSGTPGTGDVGLNSWTVEVADGISGTDTATMEIMVLPYNRLTIVGVTAGAEQPGNWAVNSFDGKETTRWANINTLAGSWITYDLGDSFTIDRVSLLQVSGATRTNPLRIEIDGVTVFSGNTTTTTGYWNANFAPTTGRYITITMTGVNSDANYWLTIIEALVYGFPVVPPNQAPTWNSPPTVFNATEDAYFQSYNDWRVSDADGDTITFAKVSGPAWASVKLTGEIHGTPRQADVGTTSITLSISDGINPPVAVTADMVVANVNDAPVFSIDPINQADAAENSAYSGSINNATDVDGDSLTYSKVSGPAWLSVAANGDLSGTPTSGDVGANSWTVQVSDSNGGSDTATLNITVNGLPMGTTMISGYSAGSNLLSPNSEVLFVDYGALGGNDLNRTSPNSSDTWLIPGAGLWNIGDTVEITGVAFAVVGAGSTDGTITFDVLQGSGGVGASGAGALASLGTATATFTNAGTSVYYANFDTPVSFVVDSNSTNIGIHVASSSSIRLKTLSGYPVTRYDKVTGNLTTGVQVSVAGNVIPSNNHAPAFTVDPINEASALEGAAYSGSVANATDADSDPLTYSAISGPAWLNVGSNGTLSGTPGNGDVGMNSWTIQVSDGNGGSDTATLNITVNAVPVNQAPVWNFIPTSYSATAGTEFQNFNDWRVSDPEGDAITFAKVSGPIWVTVKLTGEIVGTPGAGDVGTSSLTISITDSINTPVQITAALIVSPAAVSSTHVSSIVPGVASAGGPNKFGVATVTILDANNQPVSGATVSGTFTGSYGETVSAVTNVSGVAVIQTLAKTKNPSFTFSVNSVTASGYIYNPAANVETSDSY